MQTPIPSQIQIQKTDRLLFVDVAKGLGMMLVVVGHVGAFERWHEAIYTFHMPLFFVLSGLVFKPASLRGSSLRKTLALMVPYA